MDDLYLHKMAKKMIELNQVIKDDLSALKQIYDNNPKSKYSVIALIELLEEYIEILEDKTHGK